MQGSDDADVDRWFGMFRSVGLDRLGDARYQAMRRERWRRVRNAALISAAVIAAWSLLVTWDPPGLGILVSVLPGIVVAPLWTMVDSIPPFFAVRPDHDVEFFEGRVPRVQGFRDGLTDALVSKQLVGTERDHRLTVHRATGLLLEVDGAAVTKFVGEVVTTAPVPVRAGVATAVGERRPLTLTEAEELAAITARRTRRDWAMAVTYAALLTVAVAWPVAALSNGLSAQVMGIMAMVFVLSLTGARFLIWKSAQALRARAAADLAGGLVRGTTTWRLPVLDLVWERDGLPSFERLERGGLAGPKRALTRPQTF